MLNDFWAKALFAVLATKDAINRHHARKGRIKPDMGGGTGPF